MRNAHPTCARLRRCAVATLMALAATLALAPAASAAHDGDLDPGFGSHGTATLDIAGGVNEFAYDVAIQPDGKIVAAGVYQSYDFALVRFKTDGLPDPTFGLSGTELTAFAIGPSRAAALALQPDGKIVVAGETEEAGDSGAHDFALARYDSDGSLDTSFSGDGKLTTDFGGDDSAHDVAIQPDGKIVVAGETSAPSDFALARYNADGSPDSTFTGFAGNNRRRVHFGGASNAFAVAIEPGGKILAFGLVDSGSGAGQFDFDFALARLEQNGVLDTSFSGDGRAATDFGGTTDEGFSLALQGDGRIVAAGEANGDFALARYNPNGSLDATFDGDGKLMTDFGTLTDGVLSVASAVAIAPNGRIVAAGGATSGGRDFALARYQPNGSLDGTFDGDGKLTSDFGGAADEANGVAIQPDGRIVAAGYTNAGSSGDYDIALARYLGDTIPPDTMIESGPADRTSDATPTFVFQAGEPGSSFACALDSGPFAPCASPLTTSPLATGAHTFAVRAIDRAGNADPTPAQRRFSVDTTPAGTTTTVPDRTRPVLSRVSLSRRRFRAGRRPTARTARGQRRRVLVGTRIRFRLSEHATVRVRIERRQAGRRVRRHGERRCVKPAHRLRHRRRCVRWPRIGTLTRTRSAGGTSVAFSGRIGRRKLHPGRYRLTLIAADTAGNRSKPKHVGFRVVAGRRR